VNTLQLAVLKSRAIGWLGLLGNHNIVAKHSLLDNCANSVAGSTSCEACEAPVLVLDEIDAVLATWDRNERRIYAGLVARLQYLPCGLIIVSHFFNYSQLAEYLPDRDSRYCLDLSGDIS